MGSSFLDMPDTTDIDDIFYMYRWYFEFYDSKDPTGNLVHPQDLLAISKISNYKTKITPTLNGSFRFRREDIPVLKAIKKRCLCTITCMKCSFIRHRPDGYEHHQFWHEFVDSEIQFSSTFEPIFDKDAFPDKFNDASEIELSDTDSNKSNLSNIDSPTRVINITFFNIVPQNAMKNLYNVVFSSGTTMWNVLNFVCAETDLSYIADKPVNENDQSEVIIPPLNLIQTLNYLQENYGLYENGIQPFVDFDNVLYVLDKYGPSHDMKDGDKPITHIYVYDTDHSGEAMSLKRFEANKALSIQNKAPVYAGTPVINSNDDEILKGELIGNDYVFSSLGQGLNAVSYDEDNNVSSDTVNEVAIVLKRNTETHSSSGEKTIVDYDEMNNMYNMTSKFNEVESLAKQIQVSFSNANISDFNVNKFVEMHYQETVKNNLLGGKYYINSAYYVFKALANANWLKTVVGMDYTSDNTDHMFMTSCNVEISLSRRNPSESV